MYCGYLEEIDHSTRLPQKACLRQKKEQLVNVTRAHLHTQGFDRLPCFPL